MVDSGDRVPAQSDPGDQAAADSLEVLRVAGNQANSHLCVALDGVFTRDPGIWWIKERVAPRYRPYAEELPVRNRGPRYYGAADRSFRISDWRTSHLAYGSGYGSAAMLQRVAGAPHEARLIYLSGYKEEPEEMAGHWLSEYRLQGQAGLVRGLDIDQVWDLVHGLTDGASRQSLPGLREPISIELVRKGELTDYTLIRRSVGLYGPQETAELLRNGIELAGEAVDMLQSIGQNQPLRHAADLLGRMAFYLGQADGVLPTEVQ